MKRYNITVNGTQYDVVVEESDGTAPAPAAAAPAPAPAPAAAPTPAPAASAEPAAPAAEVTGVTNVESPMPGVILDIKVSVGDTVSEGQPLFVLEAMKMENDINSPTAGTIAAIKVDKQANVETGTVLAVIK